MAMLRRAAVSLLLTMAVAAAAARGADAPASRQASAVRDADVLGSRQTSEAWGTRQRHWAHRVAVAKAAAADPGRAQNYTRRAGVASRARARGAGGSAGAVAGAMSRDDGAHAPEDAQRACWWDADCAQYPHCKETKPSCRCGPWGSCLPLSLHGESCSDDEQCAGRMVCSELEGAAGSCACRNGSR